MQIQSQSQGKHCEICNKGSMQRNMVSHSKRVAIRYALPNLRKIRILVKGKVNTVWICAKCLKRGKVIPALPRRLSRPDSLPASK